MKPHLKGTWCIPTVSAEFIERMERIIYLYNQPYDPAYPVICFDERPCFLIGDLIEPIALQTGVIPKEHYAYEKCGSAALLAAIEPLTGKRIAQLYSQRTMKQYTHFCQQIASAYPNATKIQLVQDNLNTHTKAAFYHHLAADEALDLANRFEFIYTPKSASWLNMIEIEFSALTRLCLNRRIASFDTLQAEITAFFKERQAKQIKIDWQFSLQAARTKLNRHYSKVHPDNAKFSDDPQPF